MQSDECVQDAEGTCQHIQEEATASWIIPSGTHYFFGHTVSGGSSSDSAATESRKDDVAGELLKIVGDWIKPFAEGGNARIGDLTEKLVMYIVARDDKVLEHGRRLGQMEAQK